MCLGLCYASASTVAGTKPVFDSLHSLFLTLCTKSVQYSGRGIDSNLSPRNQKIDRRAPADDNHHLLNYWPKTPSHADPGESHFVKAVLQE